MRKFLKKQILNMIVTLDDAHEEILKHIKSGDISMAVSIMVQCQKSAVAIGNAIEKSEGNSVKAVKYLEEYCEMLFALSESLQSGKKPGLSRIKKQMNKIENSIKEKIKAKIEIAFFPYKASMWDSLESIWLAAKEDERCECFVVPIPYYDRNPDGSLGKIHYEGNRFPDYVPIVDYQRYDPSLMLPDIAYIHNPYDQYNFVTSVHPLFYSNELKKNVRLLVYVPYYATSGNMDVNQSIFPSYLRADYIIIQSEWHRKFFSPKIPAERLLPLGSPKFDRVISMAHEKQNIPDEWQNKINGKKVYFFNTSINGFLNNTEAFLHKMAYVFNCFQGRKDVLLLWRPHPLLESTLNSVRPEFKQVYMQLKNQFIESGLGIYDDTPDIDVSIAISDVYIGDSGTSVISLFGMAGKPIFILNNYLDAEPEPEDFTTYAFSNNAFIEDNVVYDLCCSWLISFDLKSRRFEPICKLTDMTYARYKDVIKMDDRFYIGPTDARDICVVEKSKLRKIFLNELNDKPCSFVKMIRYKHCLYLIPGRYPALVRYDTDSDELTYYSDFINKFSESKDGITFSQGVCIRGDLLYIASAFDNRILIFDLEKENYSIKEVGQAKDRGCQSMTDDGTYLWVLPAKGNTIVRWNPETEDIIEYSDYPEGFTCSQPIYGLEHDKSPFLSAICFDDFILFVPFWANIFIKIEKKSGKMSIWDIPVTLPQKPKNCYYNCGMPFGATTKTGPKSFMVFSYYDRVLYDFDVETGKYTQRQYKTDIEFFQKNQYGFNQASEWQQYACIESGFNTLPNFLNGELNGKLFDVKRQYELYSKISANGDGTCGEKVHSRIMEKYLQKSR